MALVKCPDCDKEVSDSAPTCPNCGRPMKEQPAVAPAPQPAQSTWNPGIAAVLSLVIPGAGQMYKGNVIEGMFWLLFVAGGYVLYIFPGLILHIFCILGAASGKKKS